MALIVIAVVPSIALLAYIYYLDKLEKEPLRLLIKCFCFGVFACMPAAIIEVIGENFLGNFFRESNPLFTIIDYFLIVALVEELCKFIGLKLYIDRSKEYNCMFDGIVYSVFTSLGFATFENILYVIEGGFGVGLGRMFTSIPGHLSFAVYMGYFYSQKKYAQYEGRKKDVSKYGWFTLLIPILLHGSYDCLISFNEEGIGTWGVFFAILLWLCYVIAMFIFTFVFVKRAARNDRYIVEFINEGVRKFQVVKGPEWTCSCGHTNYGRFCVKCGKKKEDSVNTADSENG